MPLRVAARTLDPANSVAQSGLNAGLRSTKNLFSSLRPTSQCRRFFFFQAEDGIRDKLVTGVQTCALPISLCRSLRAAVDARNSRQHVKNDKASASIELLDLRPNDPKSVRVEEQMKQPNVNKDRSNEPPPLAFRNFGIRLHTKCHQRRLVGAASGQRHQKKNENIQSEEDVCISGTPCPDSLKKVEMVVRNH